MTNFEFLKSEWPDIYTEAKEAEALTFTSPKACVMICRSALEKTVQWLYANDPDLQMPYDTRLSSLMNEQCFRNILKPSILTEINLVRKFGNNAAHGNSIKREESLVAIKNLFRFLSFVAIYYAEERPEIKPFDESLVPRGDEQKVKQEELKKLEEQLERRRLKEEEKRKLLKEQAGRIEALQRQLLQQKALVHERKESRKKIVVIERDVPQLIPESVTRKLYIDQSLKEAGWNKLREGYELEYEVKGMPLSTNPSGTGYADYVLWGDDGKPLAVIEAKKTMADSHVGKHQASLYADCLEKMHGQRPVIFYSNGFETYIWDDTFYPERLVYGFYTKDELQRCIDRRIIRKDLRLFQINENITDRYYQKEALKRVAEAFVHEDKSHNMKAGARKALLVMATGSGKTRVSAAIVDMLTKCNWVKRILFLADRNALVTQAKNAFAEYLPHLSSIDLTKESEDSGTRIVFSTYPTILNRIDAIRNNDERFYSSGHFDLIIIDEAHRSVYQKYGAIFDYFDSLLIGLTATPKKEIDRNTYNLFEIADDSPTYAYELDQAVKDGYLVPPKAMSVPVKFLRQGIHYDELSEQEKQEYEEKFGDPTTGEAPDEIGSEALNSWLFNTDTVDKVLSHLMTYGLHVEGGDKLGKTIIFAKNHEHALFIDERFSKNYPEHAGKFLRVIDNYESKAQDLIDRFVDPVKEYDPQIAVSVDMLDTGVDAPRVVNLVFFKLVRSSSKFWQMIGRGTRLCHDLYGPEQDKEFFILFDYCQNLEFFKANPDGIDGNSMKSLTQRIFELRLDVVVAIREKSDKSEAEQNIEDLYVEQLYNQVKSLDESRFEVKMHLRYVKHFSSRKSWQRLSLSEVQKLKEHVSKLILPEEKDHELARRFDIIMLNLNLATLLFQNPGRFISRVVSIAKQLSMVNVPAVKTNQQLLKDLQSELFWKSATVRKFEDVRVTVRELMKYLENSSKKPVYTTFNDDIDIDNIIEEPIISISQSLKSYRDRVESYIRNNRHHLTIQKLRNNIPITHNELVTLENMLFDGQDRGTKEDFIREYGAQPLGVFIRSIVGLDIQAANQAFSDFIQKGNLKADQMTFIKYIIDFLTKNGTIDKAMLFEPPFTDINDMGILGVFDDADTMKVTRIIDLINRNAGVA